MNSLVFLGFGEAGFLSEPARKPTNQKKQNPLESSHPLLQPHLTLTCRMSSGDPSSEIRSRGGPALYPWRSW